ncbi:hypothetical protein [Zunongwangia endophytica]|uniref:Uncharacterized protein n=1 Tax=Zunongwangia endophytica TaxID=1808945 RepID=A0ABV8HA72_9FLAO|nr:hypothetical protein [Zunongwangia endophytica]MDN3593950.1 hypothetical protein [Zunongwangia endophytica]
MKKLLKGILGLFILNLIIVAVSFSIQSCSSDNELEDGRDEKLDLAIQEFKNAIKKEGEVYNLELSKLEKSNNAVYKTNNDVPIDFIDDNPDPMAQLAVNFEQGIHNSSINILRAYEFSNSDIIQEFGNMDSPEISVVANIVVALEDKLDQDQKVNFMDETDIEFASLFGISKAYSYQGDTLGGCIMDAVGIAAVFELFGHGLNKKMKKKAIKKVIRKVAVKYLGYVGAALAVYDFVDCMDWI